MSAGQSERFVDNGHTRWSMRLRRFAVFLHDLVWIPLSLAVAFWLRFGAYDPTHLPEVRALGEFAIIAVVAHSLALWWRGCYRGLWRYASLPDLLRLVQAVCVGVLLSLAGAFMSGRLGGFPRSILLIYPFVLLIGMGSGRLVYRMWKDHSFVLGFKGGSRAVVIGAGRAGELLIRDLRRNRAYVPVTILDDDLTKQKREIHGVQVNGTLADLETTIQRLDVEAVLFAIPTASRSVLRHIVGICEKLEVPCRTLPPIAELIDGRVTVDSLRPVSVEDLLGREPVRLRSERVQQWLTDRRVLVTGGGGSIGFELCRQVMQAGAARLLVVDNCEYNLYKGLMELHETWPDAVEGRLLDVTDSENIDRTFADFHPDYVFHAAAYKHVPLVELNPEAGVRVNVFGTRIVAQAAARYGARRFVLVSTDKAVAPCNVMGATKRIAECICESMNENLNSQFAVVRFGNVLGSAGSVVPRFRSQVEGGGPVTVTHPEMQRYFMTIPEAVSLILEAGASTLGGGIFVLDMGEPVLIRELAEQMIRLSGLEPGRDVQIVYTGLRPGEKLYEELFYPEEQRLGTDHPKLMLAASVVPLNRENLALQLQELARGLQNGDPDSIHGALRAIVPTYRPRIPPQSHRNDQHPRLVPLGG